MEKYLRSLEEEKERLRSEKAIEYKRKAESHKATLDSAEAAMQSAKYAKSSSQAAWVAGLLAALAIGFSVYQYKDPQSKDADVDSLKLELNRLTDQIRKLKEVKRIH